MSDMIVGLLAETFIHSGIGQNEGAIDLPVAREAATDFPFIPGSGFKGALKDYAIYNGLLKDEQKHQSCFGLHDNAGSLLIADVRILLLPVRSLNGSYKWITCSHILERFSRDIDRAGLSKTISSPLLSKEPEEGKVLGKGQGVLFLEERSFKFDGEPPEALVESLNLLIKHSKTKSRLADQLVILSNDDFSWFARYGLAIQTRNVLDPDTKESKNLWTEESLPPDTLMYCLLGERNDKEPVSTIKELIDSYPYIQTGGNETVGQGWFAMTCLQ